MTYKKVFVDSDIILDLLLRREPFVNYSQVLFTGIDKPFKLYTSTLILANVHYIVQKNTNKKLAKALVKGITELIGILSFEAEHIISATNNDHSDFEDSIQYYIARQNNCDLIISRNIKHYKTFDISVLTAEQFLRSIL